MGSLPVQVRIPPDQLADLEAWIAAQSDPKLTRPEAIRRLMQIGLERSRPPVRGDLPMPRRPSRS